MAVPGTKMVSHKYQVINPGMAFIKNPDGNISLVGYGIGDAIDALRPALCYTVASHEEYDEIPLADGTFILDYTDSLQVGPWPYE